MQNLDFSQIKQIICHPSLVEKIRKLTIQKSDYTQLVSEIEIISDPDMELERWTGKWLRRGDDRFVEWVEDDELENPKDWQIYFGFVEKEMEENIFVIKSRGSYFDGFKTMPILNNKTRFSLYKNFV